MNKQSAKFEYKDYTVTRRSISHTQHEASIKDSKGADLLGGDIAADIKTASGYKTDYDATRVNPYMSTDAEIMAIIDRTQQKYEEHTETLTRKLADANVKDLSSNEIYRAFKDVALPKWCRTAATILINAGIITMDKVNAMLQADRDDRRKCQEREAGHTHLYKFSFTGRPGGAIGKIFKISAEYRAADIKTAINTLYGSYEHIEKMKATKNGIPVSIEI